MLIGCLLNADWSEGETYAGAVVNPGEAAVMQTNVDAGEELIMTFDFWEATSEMEAVVSTVPLQ